MSNPSGRLLALLSLLQTRRDWPGSLLAERLEVSARTVRRDVDRLRELGYPIAASPGPDGGYRLDAGSELPPLLFDDEQAVALAVALQTAATSVAGIEEAAERALRTLRQVLPARLRGRVDALQVTAVAGTGNRSHPQVDPQVLVALSAAVHAEEVLRFDYTPGTPSGDAGPGGAGLPTRRVEPHHLVTWGGRWYLVAWDLDREDWRTFRVDRLVPKANTGPRFRPRPLPEGDVAEFITSRFLGPERSAGPDGWPCRGEVVLHRPAAEVSRYARGGVVEALDPKRCRLVLGAWSWPGLAAMIGQFDAEVEVIEPVELRDAFATLARRFSAAAGSTTS